ncbi:glycosyltransferase [Propionicimonas sp.]|uniref:glycosyltransferase n=1 Tax=Propionicimonas sp. TaxID=1955623 RepID=UPI001DE78C21|nr:glycosyltransferase [Propionicimonas sp.]MBU3977049.1 glycosyltransferase [Actinomycetota bacterium]MBU3984989.1 glycosyltransferase [Actinomycetota bacterium]MBU4007054.1 glycosyltransferase [Actinomycetota bacterium]MBU4064807.1 glycosyltransferase [Actinomycetota bacterium]MBU4094319.1 glycosyltransferase [Actinomycetota bacterium]
MNDTEPAISPTQGSRLLVLTSRFPYPVVGGDRLRLYRLCVELAKDHQLTLLSLCDDPSELTAEVPADGVFVHVERFYLPKWRSWLNSLLAIPGRTPLQVAYYRSAPFIARARELAAEHDGVLAHLIRTGAGIADLPGPKFLELTDAISLNYERAKSASARHWLDPRTIAYRLETGRLKPYEQQIVTKFDHSFLVSGIDLEHLFAADDPRREQVLVCGNGADLDALAYQFAAGGTDAAFIGNLKSLQNFDAALHFAADILPLVRAQRPQVRFRVVGRIDEAGAATLAAYDGVDVVGEVDDVAAAVAGAGIGVAPLRIGAGVQNKVLEYFALGLPCISTPLALEGFGAVDGQELLVAEAPADFAAAVIRLLDDRVAAELMAQAARGYVERHHSWAQVLAPLRQVVADGLAVRRSS